MHLSYNEMRVRASKFASEWQDAHYEKGETQSFYDDFFDVFGVKRRSVARYEAQVARLGQHRGFIDLFWPGVLLVEQKSAGRSLESAREQAFSYFDALQESEKPRYLLLSDFQTFELLDVDERDEIAFPLSDLSKHVERFGFINGREKRTFVDQDPVNNHAAEVMGRLHDALKDSGYTKELDLFLVRILFCLFADNTGIFEPRDILLEFLETCTREDGSDVGERLLRLFQVLQTPQDKRQSNLDEDLARFPYVNGDLFAERLSFPDFDSKMRQALIEACRFDWSKVSPAIFGSLFQSVMAPKERRQQGAHYTTEKNILKVIEPLFMDDLRTEFKRIKARKDSRRQSELAAFHERLSQMKLLDPACGCGNFLIIAYRELRKLELDLIKARLGDNQQLHMDAAELSRITVNQFYGIELDPFAAEIAKTALWMMDHIMNNELSTRFGLVFVRIPLEGTPHILCDDALETEWSELLPPQECSYVLGNPPFGGAKFQTKSQRAQVHRIANLGKSGGTLDYVCAWFIKAGAYIQQGHAKIGFVATNSVTQDEQVAQFAPLLFQRFGIEIIFAHRTFAWGSDARGKAHVHVVILGLGLAARATPKRRLFSYEDINGDPHRKRA